MDIRLNENNERLKRRFLEYRKYAGRLSDASLDRELAALEMFDVWNGRKDFSKFHIQQAMGFRDHLEKAKNQKGKPLSKSTMRSILKTLREFVLWLAQQDGFKKRIRLADADYFSLSRRDEAEARAAPARPSPSISQAKRALAEMGSDTPRDLRDKAIFSLLCLTGVRVAALISLRIKHIDLEEKSLVQNPREVNTKFAKHIDTFFSRSFPEAELTLADWLQHLDETELFGPDDPLFPASRISATSNQGFKANGFERRHWKSTEPVRKIVNNAFGAVGLQSFGPHAFRHMLVRQAVSESGSVAEFVANSQNLGHSDVLTTLRSYGQISRERQRELITGQKSHED